MRKINVSIFGELNDFLKPNMRDKEINIDFIEKRSAKDLIESIGIPHTEVFAIKINGGFSDFDSIIDQNDKLLVYPMSVSRSDNILDRNILKKLRKDYLEIEKFIVDVNLGRLARYLRLMGFDSLYDNNYPDEDIAQFSKEQNRIVLTRDVGLLKRKDISHGYWVRSDKPREQLDEVVIRFGLQDKIQKMKYCSHCNGKLFEVAKEEIIDQLKKKTEENFNKFYQCNDCKKIYWKGSHFDNIEKIAINLKSI